MFTKKSPLGYVSPVAGVRRKTLVFGEKTLLAEFLLEKGSVLPTHKHPHEQTGYLVSGKITLYFGKEKHDVNPGDSWVIPGDMEHWAEIAEDSVAVEVFAPAREDFLPEK